MELLLLKVGNQQEIGLQTSVREECPISVDELRLQSGKEEGWHDLA